MAGLFLWICLFCGLPIVYAIGRAFGIDLDDEGSYPEWLNKLFNLL